MRRIIIDYQRVILTTKTEENSIIFSLKGKNIIFRKKNVTGTFKNVTGTLSNLSKIVTATFFMSRAQFWKFVTATPKNVTGTFFGRKLSRPLFFHGQFFENCHGHSKKSHGENKKHCIFRKQSWTQKTEPMDHQSETDWLSFLRSTKLAWHRAFFSNAVNTGEMSSVFSMHGMIRTIFCGRRNTF